MTQVRDDDPVDGPADPAAPRPTRAARHEAADVAGSARDAGEHVARTAAEHARHVAEEGTRQARDVLREGHDQVLEQARAGQRLAAERIGAFGDELVEMAGKTKGAGPGSELARRGAERAHSVASWLEEREPADLVDEVRSFARRRPGTFLLGAAVAGVLVGRLTRGVLAAGRDDDGAAGAEHDHHGDGGDPRGDDHGRHGDGGQYGGDGRHGRDGRYETGADTVPTGTPTVGPLRREPPEPVTLPGTEVPPGFAGGGSRPATLADGVPRPTPSPEDRVPPPQYYAAHGGPGLTDDPPPVIPRTAAPLGASEVVAPGVVSPGAPPPPPPAPLRASREALPPEPDPSEPRPGELPWDDGTPVDVPPDAPYGGWGPPPPGGFEPYPADEPAPGGWDRARPPRGSVRR